MKHQQFCESESGKMVRKFLEGITFLYDICLGHPRDHWKGLYIENNSYLEGPMPCIYQQLCKP